MRQLRDRSVYISMISRITVRINGDYGIPDDINSYISCAISTTKYHMIQFGFIYTHNKATVDGNEVMLEGVLERVVSVKAGTYRAAEERAVKMAQEQFSKFRACNMTLENALYEVEALRDLAS